MRELNTSETSIIVTGLVLLAEEAYCDDGSEVMLLPSEQDCVLVSEEEIVHLRHSLEREAK